MPVRVPDDERGRFFDFSLDLLCICGFDGSLSWWNAGFERLLGYSRQELKSRVFVEFVHPDDVKRSRDALAQLASGQELVRFENRLVCADGTVRLFEWNAHPIPDLGLVYGIARDVSVRSALAEEQAALRRVATLVARESSPDDVFAAVAEEVARVVDVGSTAMLRYDDGGNVTLLGSWGELPAPVPIGTRFPLQGDNISSRVFRTARPARIDHYAEASGAIASASKTVGVRHADHRQRATLGRDDRHLRRAAGGGHGVTDAGVHRAGRHGDRKH